MGVKGSGRASFDEGNALPGRGGYNFVGSGVTATDNPATGRTDVTIPGGGAGSIDLDAVTGQVWLANQAGYLTNSTSDQSAIWQAAVNKALNTGGMGSYTGGRVNAPAGYSFAKNVNLNQPGKAYPQPVIAGTGANTSGVSQHGTSTTDAIFYVNDDSWTAGDIPPSPIWFQDMYLANGGGSGIRMNFVRPYVSINGAYRCVIKDSWFWGPQATNSNVWAIDLSSATQMTRLYNLVVEGHSNGIRLGQPGLMGDGSNYSFGTTASVIQDCRVVASYGWGLYLTNHGAVTRVLGGDYEQHALGGIYVGPGCNWYHLRLYGTLIQGVYFEQNPNDIRCADGCGPVMLRDNYHFQPQAGDATKPQIYIESGAGPIIIDRAYSGWTGAGAGSKVVIYNASAASNVRVSNSQYQMAAASPNGVTDAGGNY